MESSGIVLVGWGQLEQSSLRIETWASEDNGLWSVLIVDEDSVACVVASGTDWTKPNKT